jgi:monoamine oxidase
MAVAGNAIRDFLGDCKMRSIYARLHRRYGKKITGEQRRHFVEQKLKTTALPEVMPRAKWLATRGASALSAGPRPRVAIVGGGFAGLMAGYALANHCAVTVFEARERVGGRVWSKARPGGVVEAGGELIGYNHPLWLKLARKFELGLSVITSDTNYDALALKMPLYLDGKKLSDGDMEDIYDEMNRAFTTMSKRATAIDPHRPWLAEDAEKLDRKSLSDWIAGLRCLPLTKLAMEEQFSNDAGRPSSEQSYLANLAVVAGGVLGEQFDAFFTQTETLRCSEGNDTLAKCLAEAIKDAGGNVRLSTQVSAIRINEADATLELRKADASGQPEEGEKFTADYIVLAIPPSLWPGAGCSTIAITPALPRDYYVSMGTAIKYLSPLKKRFWIGEGLAPTATSNQFGVTWEGTDNQIAAPGEEVGLSLFAGGPVARSALEVYERRGKCAVDEFYALKIGAIYSGYQDNLAAAPDFIAWPKDPWTRAGYSCPAPGEVCRAGPLLNKAFQKRMYFAGEHTCFAYFGYMEGALQSGQRAASSILKAVARQNKKAN